MAIDIYEDNAGGIVLVNTAYIVGNKTSMIGVVIVRTSDKYAWGSAKHDCNVLAKCDDPAEQFAYSADDVYTGDALTALIVNSSNIATWYGEDVPLTVWSHKTGEDRPSWNCEPGISGKWYLGIS